MLINGRLYLQFRDALLSAFPTPTSLEAMVQFRLDQQLDVIAGGANYGEVAFNLIKWAKAHGRLDALLAGARGENAGNPELLAFADAVAAQQASPPKMATVTTMGSGAVTVSAPAGGPERLRGRLKLWPHAHTLGVGFLDGAAAMRWRVLSIAQEWTRHAFLRFRMVKPEQADVRVSFKDAGGSWSMQGTDARTTPAKQATINFGWLRNDTTDAEAERVVLHEFGHAIGLLHEHQNPNAKIDWDWDLLYRQFCGPPNSWTVEQVEENFQAYDAASLAEYRDFDPDSIMMHPFPAELTRDGAVFAPPGTLSPGDMAFAARLYPR